MKYKFGNNENRVYKNKPDGWRVDKKATSHPLGTVWIHNGKSRFQAVTAQEGASRHG